MLRDFDSFVFHVFHIRFSLGDESGVRNEKNNWMNSEFK